MHNQFRHYSPDNILDWEDRDSIIDQLGTLQQFGHVHLYANDVDADTTDVAYNTGTYHWGDGKLIANTSADYKHNHWGVYTRAFPTSDSNPRREKRMSIQGGSEDTDIDIYSRKGDAALSLHSASGSENGFIFRPGDRMVRMMVDDEDGDLYAYDHRGGQNLFTFGTSENSGEIGGVLGQAIEDAANPSPVERTVNAASDVPVQTLTWDSESQRLYYRHSSDSEAHFFNPDGSIE